MKELNNFREFMAEGKGSTVKLSKSDMDKLHKDKEIEVDDHTIQFGEGEENVSENALGIDREDGTFEITPNIEIMGQSFNFSDICPSAHKLVQNQAIVHQGFSRTAPIVLMFAILHRDFFALERKALGSQGIDIDTFKNDVTRLYTEILNVAEKLGVRKQAKEYMDMHMGKIKDAGFKASEPGGSSDRNKELDFSDDIEYEQDWRDERDAMFGKPMGKLEEQLAEVRSRLENEIEGYTDLHENDVALEAFLGEEKLDEKQKYADDQLKFKKGDTVYFKNVKDGKKLPMTITGPGKFMKSNRLDAGGKEVVFPVKGGPGGKGMYAADDLIKEDLEEEKLNEGKYKVSISKNGSPSETILYDTEEKANAEAEKVNKGFMNYGGAEFKATVAKPTEEEKLNEEIEMVEPKRGHDFYKLNKDVELELQTGSTSVTNAPRVLLHPVFGKKIIAREGQYIISFFGQLFYVDMDEKFATKVPKHEDSDNMKNLRGALVPVDMAPNFNPGWKSYLNKPLEEGKESLTQQIMKKYPKKYPDEKAVKAAAKELMKDPKYKVNRGIFPVLYALLKGK